MSSTETISGSEPPAEGPVYTYKPALMASPRELRLTADAVEVRWGLRAFRVRYDRIRRVRLSFKPITLQHMRFVAEIWSDDVPKFEIASTSWKSLVEQDRLDGPYGVFVAELHRRLIAAGTRASFETGSPPLLYWPGVAVLVAVSLGLAALIVRALQTGGWSGAAFVAAFLGLFLWQAGTFFRRNRPGTYRPDALPHDVLPKL